MRGASRITSARDVPAAALQHSTADLIQDAGQGPDVPTARALKPAAARVALRCGLGVGRRALTTGGTAPDQLQVVGQQVETGLGGHPPDLALDAAGLQRDDGAALD